MNPIMKNAPHGRANREARMESKTLRGQEILKKRTHNAKVFDLGRGAYQIVQYPDTVHYQDESGAWMEIDNRLDEMKNRSGASVLRNRRNRISVEFAKETGKAPLVSLATPSGHGLAWELRGARAGITAQTSLSPMQDNPDEDARRADLSHVETELTYEEILPHVDLICRIQGTAFKDDIVLKNAQAPHEVTFDLTAQGVDPVMQEGGAMAAYASGQPDRILFTLPAAFMRDSAGRIGEVTTRLLQEDGRNRLTLTCDPAFLADAAFPVVIDPLVQTEEHSSAMEDNFVTDSAPNTVQGYAGGRLRICDNTSYGECRSFLKFTDLPYFLPSHMVTKAYLRMSLYTQQGSQAVPVYLREVLGSWSSQTITWNNQPALGEHDVDVVTVPANAGVGSTFAFDISNLVRKWYTGSNHGMAFERRITSTPNTVEFGSSDSVYHKPVIQINYVSFAGLQGHLAYDSMDCGRAGTGHVNLYNGDLVVERPLTRCGGSRMPVSLTAYYGTGLYGNTASMGSGWRLSCDQGMGKTYINDELHFVWYKGDGSRHYFKKKSSADSHYEDLSGLSLKLTDGTYTEITDKQGTVMRFESPKDALDDMGRLLSITDSCANTCTFQYTGWNLTGITDGAGRTTTISYSGNKVSALLAPGETTPVTFSYYNNRLNGITDADGTSTTILWDSRSGQYTTEYYLAGMNGSDGRCLEFSYPYAAPYRVSRMRMVHPAGEDIETGNSHAYTYGDMLTLVKDLTVANGKRMLYQFNDFGNVVCVRDELGYASYSRFSEDLLPNHPQQVSKLQRSVINLLPNHDFEMSGYWSHVCYYDGQANFTYDTAQKYMGTRSTKVDKTTDVGNACVYQNYTNLTVGKTYTFSGYIRSSGSVYTYATVSCGSQWFDGEKVTPGSEWTRIFTTFTAAAASATLYFITMGGPGTVWIDCAQLEEGAVPNRYNLLRNGDFSQNSSGVPLFWTANGYNTSSDAIVTGEDPLHPTFLTPNRMRLYGDPQANKGIYQDLPISGSQGDVFVAGGWAKGFSRPIGQEPRRFGLRVAFKNSAGTLVDSDILHWNEEWTDWQYLSGAVIAPCAYTGIRFNVDYEKNVNYADFDGLTLYKEEFGNTFAYDEDGNVTAVKNLAGKQAKAEYDAFDNLTSYVQPGRPDSVKTSIYYGSTDAEKKKRLPLRIDSPLNIRTNNQYDSMGNRTYSYQIDAMDGSCVIESRQSYTADGNHVATKTDARGKVVSYVTDLAKDTLTSVTDPNGQSVAYTYDSRRRVTSTTATAGDMTYKNAYTYENDRLKTVAHNTTGDTPDVTYTFDYDAFGHPTTVKVGTQTLSTNVYTDTGDRTLTRVEYGNGGKVHYTRDDFRRVTGIHYDNATTPRFTYDYGANGQIAYVRDNELNRTVWTEYDTSERPTRVHLLENATNASIGTPKYVSTTSYDEFGNVAAFREKVNDSASYETTYTYDVENKPTQLRYGADDRKVTITYDPIGRISTRTAAGNVNYVTTYAYVPASESNSALTTPLVQSITQNGQNFSYTYDDVGNIASVTRNGLTTTYVYDTLGQLTRVNDPHTNKSTVYLYDRGGNITGYLGAPYSLAEPLGGINEMVFYSYGDSNWKDKVTAIGGKAITYDAIGNPLSYDGWTFTWKAGRMLDSLVKTGTNAQFSYDHNGLRIKKVVNGVTTHYTLSGRNIVHMTQGSSDLHFFYDAQGRPAMVRFGGTDYFYVYDLQGDVVAMVDTDGTQVVEYMYDAWGAPISKTGSLASTLGSLNPFRYRGYVYDEETGLYYLRTRYYNPLWKRFISSDIWTGKIGSLVTHNLFAYTLGNPVKYYDPTGAGAITAS
ncbi:MAG TPA: DNRLRE domain-containing protein, partial [Candidatus Ventricola intestinavium]|nr:DNRLRE domain-containing protein [Candidatus Ventricola intestinavium]